MDPTPTTSETLPLRRADFSSLPEALDYAARGKAGLNFYAARGDLVATLPYAELRERAVATARGLIRAGLPRGARLLLIADTDPDFMVLFLACQYASILPVPVALPAGLGGRDAYVATLRRQLSGSGAVAAMAPEGFLKYLQEAAADLDVGLIGGAADFYDLPQDRVDLRPFGPDDRSYLQYSSGSTRFPLGVDVPQRALMSNCHAIVHHGLDVRPGDRGTSWLPLYHDMGLVGFMLTPLTTQMSVDYLATRDFARRPLMWLSLLSRNGGTLSYSPSFGYDLCARRLRDGSGVSLDLAPWRAAGIGGDMIQPQILSAFADAFEPHGFRRTAFTPSYGMAETTLAVSFSPVDQGIQVDSIDRRRLADDHRAEPIAADRENARTFVICGRPLPDHKAEIRDETGQVLPDRRLGRIFVKGPSVMAGYFDNPAATAEVLGADGWLNTGDLGYMIDGALVITGRSKDLIIINGRNIWPQDLEWAAETLPGLRRGDAAAFSIEGTNADSREEVVLLVQCRLTDAAARANLRQEIQGTLQRTAAVECRVVLIPPHSLPQTSSGKLSRSRAKENFLNGVYPVPDAEDDALPDPDRAIPSATAGN
ncbi:fatty acyl-AMP ligase [Rhodospirillaceae bacterium SYSU D60014]|uniref:fatty acyl-AMP ligase n=1 Tax=Virgifigura deserti TaxID=2268457 RepID=UPI000E66EF31